MKNKIKVSVGISAYNEEKNIKEIIQMILKQEQTTWSLVEVIVACDGCTDNTEDYVKSVKSDKIRVIISHKRRGKTFNVQKIIDSFIGNYLVMLDADVSLSNNLIIERLVSVFQENKTISVVGGNPLPFMPQTFFEKAVYSTFYVLGESRKFVKGGNSVYGCSGQCLAMKKEFAKTIRFPRKIVAEDDYIYFSCITKGKLFRHCTQAVVYYKLPKTLRDYLRQIFRSDPDVAVRNAEKYFGKIVGEEYRRPFVSYLKAVIRAIIDNPPGAFLMIAIRLLAKPLVPIISNNYKLEWFTATSTK